MTAMRLKRYPSPSGGIALGKMGVGATMMKQGKTARDYVQDGLVAMWDGIENAGWGVHDPNAATWADLVGSNDITIPSGSGMYFGQSFLHRGSSGVLNTNIPVCAFGTTTEMVIDVSNENTASGNARLFGSIDTGKRFEVDCYSQNTTQGPRIYYRRNGTTTNSTIYGYFGRSSAWGLWSIRYSLDNTGILTVGDLVSNKETSSGTNTADSTFYGQTALCLGSWSTSGPIIGNIYSVRRYNRVLSASEKAYNYAIDKERFNLP